MHIHWEGIWVSALEAWVSFIIIIICCIIVGALLAINIYQNYFIDNNTLWQTKTCFLAFMVSSLCYVATMVSDTSAILFFGANISCAARAIYSLALFGIARFFLYQYLLLRLYFTFLDSVFQITLRTILALSISFTVALLACFAWISYIFITTDCREENFGLLPGVIEDLIVSLIVLYIFVWKLTQLIKMYSQGQYNTKDTTNNKNKNNTHNNLKYNNSNNNNDNTKTIDLSDNTCSKNDDNGDRVTNGQNFELTFNARPIHQLLYIHTKLTLLTAIAIIATFADYAMSTITRPSTTGCVDTVINCSIMLLSFSINDKVYGKLCYVCRIHCCRFCFICCSKCNRALTSVRSSYSKSSGQTPSSTSSASLPPASPSLSSTAVFQSFFLNGKQMRSLTLSQQSAATSITQ